MRLGGPSRGRWPSRWRGGPRAIGLGRGHLLRRSARNVAVAERAVRAVAGAAAPSAAACAAACCYCAYVAGGAAACESGGGAGSECGSVLACARRAATSGRGCVRGACRSAWLGRMGQGARARWAGWGLGQAPRSPAEWVDGPLSARPPSSRRRTRGALALCAAATTGGGRVAHVAASRRQCPRRRGPSGRGYLATCAAGGWGGVGRVLAWRGGWGEAGGARWAGRGGQGAVGGARWAAHMVTSSIGLWTVAPWSGSII